MSWFRKKSKPNPSGDSLKKVPMKINTYDSKIILAWIKSLEGNAEITKWLKENGFIEITVLNQALYLKSAARNWLMENNFPHLMAFVNAMEGDAKALKWLQKYGFDDYYYMALAIDGESEGWDWIKQNQKRELFALSQVIKNIKDKIEERHNDVHSFGTD